MAPNELLSTAYTDFPCSAIFRGSLRAPHGSQSVPGTKPRNTDRGELTWSAENSDSFSLDFTKEDCSRVA